MINFTPLFFIIGVDLMAGGGSIFGGGSITSNTISSAISNSILTKAKIDSASIDIRLPSNNVSVDLAQTLEGIMKNYEVLLKQYEYLYGYLQYKGMMDEQDFKVFCESQEVAEKLKESK